ncbi:MAG TPA: hypothetical protein DIT64_20955 [Verrucomicrobiales bacterium]|nr:hypothetical protein [Verrucomicrobiales bacterium]HCN77309.1 hypothetical protein [Verrucomicrobiales bacterium]HRJ08685.1 hypothetical protein [Prosthecobacter sp.]HRK14014.1 hypothetical protein [Prosthecobacter sp.]
MKTNSKILIALATLVFAAASKEAAAQNGYYAAAHYAAQQAAYAQQQAAYQAYVQNQQAWAAYYAQQQAMAAQRAPAPRATPVAAPRATGSLIRFDGQYASCSASLPTQVQYLINAANHLQSSPYVRGAGHGRVEDRAYDCSSSTSYALIKAGLLKTPLTSAGFANYGHPGEGRFITIWVKPGEHVFMTICGLRLDTSGGQVGEGPRWRTKGRSYAGFTPRHPAGL